MNNCARPECTFEANENVSVFKNFCCIACKNKGAHGPSCLRKTAKCISVSCSYNRNTDPKKPDSKYCCTKCKENIHTNECANLSYQVKTPIFNEGVSFRDTEKATITTTTTKATTTKATTTKATTTRAPILFYNAQTEAFSIVSTVITPKPMNVVTSAIENPEGKILDVAGSYSNGSKNTYLFAYIATTKPDSLILPTFTPADPPAGKIAMLSSNSQLTWITNTRTYTPTQYTILGPVIPPFLYVSVLYSNDGINLIQSNVIKISPLPSAITISKVNNLVGNDRPVEGFIGGTEPYMIAYRPQLNVVFNKVINLTKMNVTPNSAASPNIPPLILKGIAIMPVFLIIQSKSALTDANMNMQYFFNNYTDFSYGYSGTHPAYVCNVNQFSTTGFDLFSLGNWFTIMAQESGSGSFFFSKSFFWDLSVKENIIEIQYSTTQYAW